MTSTSIRSLFSAALICFCTISCTATEPPAAPPAAANSNPTGVDRQVSVSRTADGASITELYTVEASVAAVDHSTRSVTLAFPDGRKTSFKASEEARNFDKVAVGDRVTAQVWEVLDVHLVRKDGPTTSDSGAAVLAAARAPKGAKPAGFFVTATEQFATVIDLDTETRQATLKFPDGKWRAIQVGTNVDLTNVKAGDKVSITHMEGAALEVSGK